MDDGPRFVVVDAASSMPDGVRHDEASNRFVMAASGCADAAYVEYEVVGGACAAAASSGGGALDLFHTFTDPAFRGKGLAGHAVKAALDYCTAHRLAVVPTCSYVAHYIKTHPEFAHLAVTSVPAVRPVPSPEVAPPTAAAAATAVPSPPEASTHRDESVDVPTDREDSEGDDEARLLRHQDHMFALAYQQYSGLVYARGQSATQATPAMGVIAADVSPSLVARMASLCVKRATELETRDPASSAAAGASSLSSAAASLTLRTPDSLRIEAAHILSLLANLYPSMGWVAGDTARIVDELDDRGFLLGFRDVRDAQSRELPPDEEEEEDEADDGTAGDEGTAAGDDEVGVSAAKRVRS